MPSAIAGRSQSPMTKRMTDHWRAVEEWAAHHRGQGHHPHPAPTKENPERWDCDCGGINRTLTVEHIAKKLRT